MPLYSNSVVYFVDKSVHVCWGLAVCKLNTCGCAGVGHTTLWPVTVWAVKSSLCCVVCHRHSIGQAHHGSDTFTQPLACPSLATVPKAT